MNMPVKKNSPNFLAVITLMCSLCIATGISAQEYPDRPVMNKKPERVEDKPQPGGGGGQMTIDIPVLMLVPVQISAEMENKGCWVKFYEKKNYEGDSLTLAGPLSLPRLIGPFGADWENKVRSIKTGPNANVTIYDNRNYRDQNKFLDPKTSIPDMSEKMGFFDDFRSMMLSCI
jgi:hypothetical protein